METVARKTQVRYGPLTARPEPNIANASSERVPRLHIEVVRVSHGAAQLSCADGSLFDVDDPFLLRVRKGRRSMPLNRVKTLVLEPMPSASTTTAIIDVSLSRRILRDA